MFKSVDINGSRLYYQVSPNMWTSAYYKYCVRLLSLVLRTAETPVSIVLGPMDHQFPANTLRLDIQSEHTLVKQGGRSVDEVVWGDVDHEDGKYLIRIPNYAYYSGLDATIEYSLPNITNMGTNDRFLDYLKTAAYVAPLIYDTSDFQEKPGPVTVTMFSSNPCERREEFTAKAKIHNNIQGVFSKEDLRHLYRSTGIMANVHQTDHHHTFEELRVLPALCNGVIIVSEDVPLKDEIPYANSIIWSSYEDLAATIEDVQRNYKLYFKRIFTDSLEKQLRQLHDGNIKGLTDLIRQIA